MLFSDDDNGGHQPMAEHMEMRDDVPEDDSSGLSRADSRLVHDVSVRLAFLWDRYVSFIHLLITLTTGSVVLTSSLITLGNTYSDLHYLYLGWGGMVAGLFCALVWRVLAQLFMEQEVFGPDCQVERYYELTGEIKAYTSSFRNTSRNVAYHRVAAFMIPTTCGSFIAGLVFLGLFFASNLTAS